jgi:hypothetical protein
MKSKIFPIVVIFLAYSFCHAQKTKKYEGVPDDLDKSKIVFVRHDSATIQPNAKGWAEKSSNKFKTYYNKIIPKSNKQLEDKAKNYPFEYIIADRGDLPKLKEQGYKYVLYCDCFDSYREGMPKAHYKMSVYYPVYLMDMNTQEIYVHDDMSEVFTMSYDKIIDYFIKKVKKKYKFK